MVVDSFQRRFQFEEAAFCVGQGCGGDGLVLHRVQAGEAAYGYVGFDRGRGGFQGGDGFAQGGDLGLDFGFQVGALLGVHLGPRGWVGAGRLEGLAALHGLDLFVRVVLAERIDRPEGGGNPAQDGDLQQQADDARHGAADGEEDREGKEDGQQKAHGKPALVRVVGRRCRS